jgi:hypothetical protein
MTVFLKQHYGDCEGPLGIPCLDSQARALDTLLRGLPKDDLHAPGHLVVEKATTELLPGERCDVSWISAESPDRMRDIVVARGMNDEHFKLNPLVTLQHAYWLPPVGRSLWRKRVKDGDLIGIKAKTQYPQRPAAWPASADWPPDLTFTLVQSGLLSGKSIGFLPTKVRPPTDDERHLRPEMEKVQRIIEEWVLLEYACVYLPAQHNAVVEAVSKGLVIPDEFQQALHLTDVLKTLPAPPMALVPFTSLEEVERHVRRRVDLIDFDSLARRAVENALDRARGRV